MSIDDRPKIVSEKSRIGEWEIDTIIGKVHSGALVTVVERVTKLTVSTRINSKSAADVTQATIALLKPFEDVVHTITLTTEKSLRTMSKSARRSRPRFTLPIPTVLGSGT